MKRAFYTGTCPHATYEEIVQLAQGADGLEIQLNEEGSAFGLSRGELHLAAACFREHGLPVVDLITHINFVGYDPELVQKGKEALDLANLLDAKAICVTLGNKLVRHNDPLEYDHMGLVKSLRELCFYAEEMDRSVWVIPCNDYTITSGLFNLTPAVGRPNFGYAWNVIRTVEQGQAPSAALRSMGKRLVHVTLEDGAPGSDADRIAYEPRPLGQGSVPLSKTVQELLEAGYTGFFAHHADSWQEFNRFMDSIPTEQLVLDPAKQLAYPMPDFLPPSGHPRVFLRREDIPLIRRNMEDPRIRDAREAFLQQVSTPTSPDWGTQIPVDGKVKPPKELLHAAEAKALYCVLFDDAEKGREAVTGMRNLCLSAAPKQWDYNANGMVIYVLGAVYDWCHPLLDEDTKQLFHDTVIRLGQHLEVGYPPVKLGAFTGHGVEAQLMRDLMAAGIAMFDEYPNIYQNTAGRFFLEYIEPRKFIYSMHCYHDGNHYANYRMQWDMQCTWLFHRMGLPRVFGEEQLDTIRNYMYVHRPDGMILSNGNANNRRKNPGKYHNTYLRMFFLAANYWKDPQMKWLVLKQLAIEPTPDGPINQEFTPVEILLFNDPDLAEAPLDSMPLLHYQPSPGGGMLIRTGWEDGMQSDDALFEMKINEYWTAGHQHLDAGAFQIYYKGLLAADTGYYQSWMEERMADRENSGYTGFGSPHHYNYTRRTIAHNCMLVYDPDEDFRDPRFKVRANDGGQRLPNQGKPPSSVADLKDPANGYQSATVLAHAWGPDANNPDYAYLKGDLTSAYSKKMEHYERSFLYLHFAKDSSTPAALVVFDHVVSAKPEFKKTWLCHGLFEPEICGNRTVFKNTRIVPGDTPWSGQYNGKLTVDTLLPGQPSITAIGGPGKEHMVDGVNYPAKLGPNQLEEGHGWRLEVSPSTPEKEDFFLHVLQVGDADGAPGLPVTRLAASTHVGAVIADRVVLLGKGRDCIQEPVCFAFDGTGTYSMVVADLAPGRWEIFCNDTPVGGAEVTKASGLAVFSGKAGTYTLRKAL